jgi:hypothetical protein
MRQKHIIITGTCLCAFKLQYEGGLREVEFLRFDQIRKPPVATSGLRRKDKERIVAAVTSTELLKASDGIRKVIRKSLIRAEVARAEAGPVVQVPGKRRSKAYGVQKRLHWTHSDIVLLRQAVAQYGT